jgi:hypothetical protein
MIYSPYAKPTYAILYLIGRPQDPIPELQAEELPSELKSYAFYPPKEEGKPSPSEA